jgi:hypothetical protein
LELPTREVMDLEVHESDLVVNPLDILRGLIHVRTKRSIPALATYKDRNDADNEFKAVKRRVEAPAKDTKFLEEQVGFEEALKKHAKTFIEEKVQPDTRERQEEAVDRILVNGSQEDEEPEAEPLRRSALRELTDKNGRVFYRDEKHRITRGEFEKRLKEEKDARR